MLAVIGVVVGWAEHKPKTVAGCAGERTHDRPSEIPLALLGIRDGPMRHPRMLADPGLCQPGRLARRAYVRAELPENPVRIRVSGYPPPRHFAPTFRFQNLGDI